VLRLRSFDSYTDTHRHRHSLPGLLGLK